MPLYHFNFSYRVTGGVTMEFDDDEEAKAFGWDEEFELTDPFYVSDIDFDPDDVDISEVDEDGKHVRELFED